MPRDLDYQGIETLYYVIKYKNFQLAAKKLDVSSSAISHRIKTLQNIHGDPLLRKSPTYQATRMGRALLGHYKRIQILEYEVMKSISHETTRLDFAIAMSKDLLELSRLEILQKRNAFKDLNLEIFTEGVSKTLEILKEGNIAACFSSLNKSINSCKSVFLGNIRYLLVCSPKFKSKYFNDNKYSKNLKISQAIKFERHDIFHNKYLAKYFNIYDKYPEAHYLPSSNALKDMLLNNLGYGLIAEIDIQDHLKKQQLVNLFEDKILELPIYLHSWDIKNTKYNSIIHSLEVFYKNELSLSI